MFAVGSPLFIFSEVTVGDAAVALGVINVADRRKHFDFAGSTGIDSDVLVITFSFSCSSSQF